MKRNSFACAFCVVVITSCTNINESKEFIVDNPSSKQGYWVKHDDLPAFNADIHSDGCSGGMSSLYSKLSFLHKKHGKELAWHNCCVVHDESYYYGGSKIEKKAADAQLNQCVNKVVGSKFLGKAMEMAVGVGGKPYLPTSYRWGYGNNFIKKISK